MSIFALSRAGLRAVPIPKCQFLHCGKGSRLILTPIVYPLSDYVFHFRYTAEFLDW